MATKNVPDIMVIIAYETCRNENFKRFPENILNDLTGEPEKVCFRAMERAYKNGYIECGVSLRTGWLTEKGKELLKTYLILNKKG